MSDDILGKNPLEGELDSIWKIPQKKPLAKPATEEEKPSRAAVVADDAGMEPSAWVPMEDTGVDEIFGEHESEADYLGSIGYLEGEEEERAAKEEYIQLVGFKLDEDLFGIDIMKVQEIIRNQELTRVPKAENFIKGVVNLRGKVIPVISLRDRFSFGATELTDEARIMIVNTAAGMIGFQVDAVTEVFRIPQSIVVPPPPSSTRLESEYITGVGRLDEKLLVILNIDRLIALKEVA